MLLFYSAFNDMTKSATVCAGGLSKLCFSSWFCSQFRWFASTRTFQSWNELQSEFHLACKGQLQWFYLLKTVP